MTTEKKAWRRVTSVTLPEDMIMEIDSIVGAPGGRSAFIELAIDHYIDCIKNSNIDANTEVSE
jgi:metal-responsive CopG/Arc/MetJ family transcriptional regulator